ncbi:helix-turn-helix domain-containing protein [Xanthobacter oligotrophicus]|uniref:helix-turn-helix domain-containing protein n=1 Tax=Xanthobacter oligotrophicus TaxID=2607286 RepID=UPI00372CFE29
MFDTKVSTPLPSPAQLRAARHLLSLAQADVAAATRLSLPTIKRAESDRDVSVSDQAVAAIRSALEAAGVIFVAENGEGPGVRLRKEK